VAAVKSRLSPNPAVLAYRNRVVAVDLVAIVVLSLYLVQRVASGGQILPTNGCGPKVTAANLPDAVQHSILDLVADFHSAYEATAKFGNPLSGVNVGVAAIASASCCATSSTATTTAVHLTGSGPTLARQAAIAAGFTGDDVNIAVALAGAESGWNPAQLEIGSGHGHGLMQIDDRYHAIPSDWTDPVTNMRLAHDIFLAANSSWTPWVTYNTGTYKRFLDIGSTGTATVQTAALTRPACTTGPGTRGVAISLASAGTGGGPVRQAAVRFALAQRGKPYVWGATGPSSYDCSGLIFAAYRSAGVSVPRTAGEQMMADTVVMPGQEQPGDQVFTELSEHDAGHTLLVIGSSQGVIHTVEAPHTGDVVKLYDVPEDGARIGRVQV
jgi:cell wall-associated NlpC family hydrolase